MASGETLLILEAAAATLPTSDSIDRDFITGASTPAELLEVSAFDAASIEYADFNLVLPENYAGGGLTITLVSGSASVAGGANQYRLEAAIRRVQDDAEDIDTTAHTYDFNGVSISPPSAIGEVSYDNITFTDGADMDSLAVGEKFVLRVRRNTGHADDTMSGDAFLHNIHIKET